MPYIYLAKEQDYHVTIDFHEIKCWIQSHNMIPVLITQNGVTQPSIITSQEASKKEHGVEEVSLVDFLDTMIVHELAFKYNDGSYELVSQEDYIDEIQDL